MAVNETIITIHPKYEVLWRDIKTRYVIITGSRRSSKSYVTAIRAAEWIAEKENWKILWVRWTMESAEISIIPEFKHKINLLGYTNKLKVKGDIVTNEVRKNTVIFRGVKTSAGNQTAKLKSIPDLNVFIVEEGEEFRSEKDFDTIDGSVSAIGVPNIVIFIMNSTDTDHFVWQRWFEKSHRMIEIDGHQIPISTHPQVTHIHTTFWDNIDNISPDYVDMIMRLRETNNEAYAHRFLGKWLLKKEGVIYPNWVEGAFDESLPYAYGLDFGFTNPDAMCKIAVDVNRMRVYIQEKMYATKQSDNSIKSKVLEIAGSNDMVVSDNNEPRIISAIAYVGVNIQEVEKYPGCVVDRIRTLSKFTWVVTPDSYNAKFEFNNYVWNDKKASIPLDKHNHLIKAAEYAATRLLQGSDFIAGNY